MASAHVNSVSLPASARDAAHDPDPDAAAGGSAAAQLDSSGSQAKYRGVTFSASSNPHYKVTINHNGRPIDVGSYPTELGE
jgi:hypothetical protein